MKRTSGYTLIELISVIMIISIVAVYLIFTWPGAEINLDAQTQQVANDIRYAQALSMTSGLSYKFIILTNTTYQIQQTIAGTPITMAQGNTTVTLNSGITFGSYSTSAIEFDGKGQPYNSTGTILAANATIPLTAGGQTETVTVTPITGSVSS